MSAARDEAVSPLARVGVVAEQLCRAQYEVRSRIARYPALYLPLARLRYRGSESKVVARGKTQIVIDGFQRSGNTFSVTAFQLAQRKPVEIAHHLHAAAQIVAAVRWTIPTVALIRPPEETVLSHIVRFPCITAEQGLKNWVRFYEKVLEVRTGVVIGDFETVTTDFGRVIREVNRRFDTSFEEFDHTESNVARCFELIEGRNADRFGTVEDHTVARPSPARDEMKERRRADLREERLAGLRRRAERAYADLVGAR